MLQTKVESGNKQQTKFTDVLFLTNQTQIPPHLVKLLVKKDLSWTKLAIEEFLESPRQLNIIGTVLVDTVEMDVRQKEQLTEVIADFGDENLAVIFLNNTIGLSISDFMLANILESGSIDELSGIIAANISYRGKAVRSDNRHSNQSAAQTVEPKSQLADELTWQLQMAGAVQRDFLPAKLPDNENIKWAAMFDPAEWVSGDIYDVARLDERHIGFYIADAVGHSMPAALLTMFIKQAIVMRETTDDSYRIFSPLETIENLNRKLTSQKLSGCQFVTCCYCLLNIKTYQLTYCRAGHPYPILIRKGSDPVQLEGTGSLLGIFENAHFSQETIQLEKHDKLLLYSDGAENIIADAGEDEEFKCTGDFYNMKDLPVGEMITKLDLLAQNLKRNRSELDDITAVAMEIL